ncbi:unnamed protein product [Cercopithifilaria johnstoni]|uniref:Uncharacterized protein n=1 Tax=Cercopithifilaria johnstoni TaxID=2874296 RepID=A0A8J2Q3E0_9BILA|nr:unnamed protein product [Cercopithifilaria johnstoni]
MKDEYVAHVGSTGGGAISIVKTKGNNNSSADEDEERCSAQSHRRTAGQLHHCFCSSFDADGNTGSGGSN